MHSVAGDESEQPHEVAPQGAAVLLQRVQHFSLDQKLQLETHINSYSCRPVLQLFQVPGYSIPTCVRCSEQLTNNSNFHQSAAAAAAVAASASAAVAASAAAAATSSSTASSSDSDAIAQQHQNPQQQHPNSQQQQQQQQQQMQSSSSSENLQSQDDSEDVSPFLSMAVCSK